MSYILTIAGLETRFGAQEILEASDHDRSGTRDDDVCQAAIDRAEDLLHSYCRAKYILPLSPTADLEQGLVADVARYYLHENRAPEEVEMRYRDAIETLQAIGAGRIILDAAHLVGTAAAGAPSFSSDTKVMGRDNTRGY